MSGETPVITVQCLSLREYFSPSNIKSMFRSFVYEYETPKIVTIHSISSKKIKKTKFYHEKRLLTLKMFVFLK